MSEPEAKPESDRGSKPDPRRDQAARMAILAVGLVFVFGLVIGFVLGRTL